MFTKYSYIFKNKGTEKRWQKKANRILKKKMLYLEVDLPSYDRGKPLFRYNGVLETIS